MVASSRETPCSDAPDGHFVFGDRDVLYKSSIMDRGPRIYISRRFHKSLLPDMSPEEATLVQTMGLVAGCGAAVAAFLWARRKKIRERRRSQYVPLLSGLTDITDDLTPLTPVFPQRLRRS